MTPSTCFVCGAACSPYFAKAFRYPELDRVHYVRCDGCGMVFAAEHLAMSEARWQRLNRHYHTGYQGSAANTDDPAWQSRLHLQAALVAELASASAIPRTRPWLDFACGDGKLASALAAKGYAVGRFDRFMGRDRPGYLPENALQPAAFDLVINTSMFEHVRDRATLDEVARLVSPNGVLAVHTEVSEAVPADPAWPYLLPVHSCFFTNRAMELLFQQWGFASSLYHDESCTWFFFRHPLESLPDPVRASIAAGRFGAKNGFVGRPAGERRSLCLVDHVANHGGGVKYALHLMAGLRRYWDVHLRSHPAALGRYRQFARGREVDFGQVLPLNLAPLLADESCGFARWLARYGQDHLGWTFRVRGPERDGRTIHLFPWLHRHDLSGFRGRGIGVFHDAIFFQIPELIGEPRLTMERGNLRTWFANLDRIVVTSQHTRRRLLALAGEQYAQKIAVIPVADTDGEESAVPDGEDALGRYGSYLVMPSNTSPHKNHRTLFAALARSRGTWNLVLTGDGTRNAPDGRITRLTDEFGLGGRVFGLGYVDKQLVSSLIAGAEALVMPTKAEGGGSFPVCEAIVAGTPVITSNIDVIVEQLERMGAQAMLFSPTDVDGLVAALDRLAAERDAIRRAARAQVARLHLRTWNDVAQDFHTLLRELYPVGSP